MFICCIHYHFVVKCKSIQSAFHLGLVVCNAVYNPKVTKMFRDAESCGCKRIGGKGMLLWQGVAAFKFFTGYDMPVDEVKERFF